MLLSMNLETLLRKHGLEFALDTYRKVGFDAVDYELCCMVKDNDRFNGDGYRVIAEEIRRAADSRGLIINQTHAPFSFSKDLVADPVAYEEIVLPRLVRSLEISGIFGAKICVIHPLQHLPYQGNEQVLFEMNMKHYRYLLPYAKEYGVKIGVENMWQRDPRRKCITASVCAFSEEFVRYIDTLDDPYAVACLDVGHVGLPANATEEPCDLVRALGHDRLQALHIHDNDYCGDQHLLPFMGKLNWTETMRALGEIDYTGDFTFETSTALISGFDAACVPIVARYLSDIGRYLMGEIEKSREA